MSSTSTSIARVRESRTQVWDVAGQTWVAMQQPIVNVGTATVDLTGTGLAKDTTLTGGSQKTQIVGSSGEAIEIVHGIEGDHYLGVGMTQDVHVLDGNSSTTNLTSSNGYAFTGTTQITLGVAGIQVSLKTDRNCQVFVEQSTTAVSPHWDIIDTFYYNTLKGGQSWTIQAVNSYVRVRVVLTGTTDTTYFRLQTCLCPVIEALPRTTDSDGHLSVGVNHIRDEHDHEAWIAPTHTLYVNQPYRLVGTTFYDGTLDTRFWTATVSGTAPAGTNTVAAGLDTIASGTAANGFAQLQSVRAARFIFAHPHLWRGLIRVPTVVVAHNTRRWGVFTTVNTPPPTSVDGCWFELSDTGVLSVCWRNAGGTVQSVPSGSFNGHVSEYTVDANVHAYEIVHYVASLTFLIDGVEIHVVAPTTANLSSTFTLPCTATTINDATGGTTGTLEVWAMTILRLGRDVTAPISYYQHNAVASVVLKRGAGQLHSIAISAVVNSAVVTLYDGLTTGGAVIWASGTMGNNTVPFSIPFNGLPFFQGLTLAITGANADATIIYE